MRYDDPLRAKLEELKTATDSHFRGRAFEAVVAEIFDRAGFDVVTNPRAARPRQTDVYASDRRNGYLIEAKSGTDRIGSPEIDEMRSRLGRQPSDVIGVIVTMGGVAEQAFAEIERDRSRVIVIIDRKEVETLIDARVDLRRLLDLKRKQLVVHGKASDAPPAGFVSSVRDHRQALRLVAEDGSELPWIKGTADYLDSCWALGIADIDWVSAGGAGVVLDLRVPADSLDTLRTALGHLRALNWLGPDPSWTIQQNSRTWNAFGLDALLVALGGRDARCADVDRPHHREILVVADVCPGGWYTLLADLDASSDWVQRVDLSIQLIGVPEDAGEIQRLRDRLAIVEPGFFRPRTARSVESRRLPEPIEVTPTAWVIEDEPNDPDDPMWARGIAFKNPLITGDGRRANPDEWPVLAVEDEHMIASLRSWHRLSEPRAGYVLESLEWARSSDATLVRAVANW